MTRLGFISLISLLPLGLFGKKKKGKSAKKCLICSGEVVERGAGVRNESDVHPVYSFTGDKDMFWKEGAEDYELSVRAGGIE